MSRTNIEIDDELISTVMSRFDLRTKREAVDFALRRVAGSIATTEGLLSLEGLGWDGDLDAMRDQPPPAV
jgi:Arc/MetJ family transcription regulator